MQQRHVALHEDFATMIDKQMLGSQHWNIG
jgi:hypothetical protein